MRKRRLMRGLIAAVAAAVVGHVAVRGGAETCSLVTKKVDTSPQAVAARGEESLEAVFADPVAQSLAFALQDGKLQEKRASADPSAAKPAFSEVIRTEPPVYHAKRPLRGVVQLGSRHYGFVLDAAPPDPSAKETPAPPKPRGRLARAIVAATRRASEGEQRAIEEYGRLYFDTDHDGDLTDEKVISCEEPPKRSGRVYYESFSFRQLQGSEWGTFPRVDLPIEVEGEKVDYAFVLRVQSRGWRSDDAVAVELLAAAWREGQITLDGQRRRVVLVDYNSNGRFDDATKLTADEDSRELVLGDMLYLLRPGRRWASSSLQGAFAASDLGGRHCVGERIGIDGRYFDLAVSPGGEKLSISPSTAPVGYVVNPNVGYRMVVHGEQGVLRIVGDAAGKAPLPEGQWTPVSYVIDRTESSTRPGPFRSSRAMLRAIARVLARQPSDSDAQATTASADMKPDSKPVTVTRDQTVPLPFGPQYRPLVKVSDPLDDGQVTLELLLVGAAGEVCDSMEVKGNRPGKPHFTITTEDGQEVASGDFEYG